MKTGPRRAGRVTWSGREIGGTSGLWAHAFRPRALEAHPSGRVTHGFERHTLHAVRLETSNQRRPIGWRPSAPATAVPPAHPRQLASGHCRAGRRSAKSPTSSSSTVPMARHGGRGSPLASGFGGLRLRCVEPCWWISKGSLDAWNSCQLGGRLALCLLLVPQAGPH